MCLDTLCKYYIVAYVYILHLTTINILKEKLLKRGLGEKRKSILEKFIKAWEKEKVSKKIIIKQRKG